MRGTSGNGLFTLLLLVILLVVAVVFAVLIYGQRESSQSITLTELASNTEKYYNSFVIVNGTLQRFLKIDIDNEFIWQPPRQPVWDPDISMLYELTDGTNSVVVSFSTLQHDKIGKTVTVNGKVIEAESRNGEFIGCILVSCRILRE